MAAKRDPADLTHRRSTRIPQANNDFDGLVKLVANKQLEVEGIARVTVDADGKITVE